RPAARAAPGLLREAGLAADLLAGVAEGVLAFRHQRLAAGDQALAFGNLLLAGFDQLVARGLDLLALGDQVIALLPLLADVLDARGMLLCAGFVGAGAGATGRQG